LPIAARIASRAPLQAFEKETTMKGRALAVELGSRYPGQDWMAQLCERTKEPRDKVEWHLQEDMDLPEQIAEAGRQMLEKESKLPSGKLDIDDLPMAGVPEFLGKLHKD
jgi:hypothetical protein